MVSVLCVGIRLVEVWLGALNNDVPTLIRW